MESGGGSGNKTTGGLASFFGAGGAGYSHADLAGVPLTGMNPLSPYLNVDPRYLVQDTDEFILPTGANKTRGRFELAFFTIGGCCMTGAAFGAMNGLRLGIKETQNMAWSKPRNVHQQVAADVPASCLGDPEVVTSSSHSSYCVYRSPCFTSPDT